MDNPDAVAAGAQRRRAGGSGRRRARYPSRTRAAAPPPSENPFGEPPRRTTRCAACASGSAARWRRSARWWRSSASAIKALLLRAAEPEAAGHGGHGAGVGRGLQPVLRLGVRGGLRGAAVRARDGPRDPAAPRGDQGERADVHPLHGRGDLRRSLGDNALAEARVGLAGPILGSVGAAAWRWSAS